MWRKGRRGVDQDSDDLLKETQKRVPSKKTVLFRRFFNRLSSTAFPSSFPLRKNGTRKSPRTSASFSSSPLRVLGWYTQITDANGNLLYALSKIFPSSPGDHCAGDDTKTKEPTLERGEGNDRGRASLLRLGEARGEKLLSFPLPVKALLHAVVQTCLVDHHLYPSFFSIPIDFSSSNEDESDEFPLSSFSAASAPQEKEEEEEISVKAEEGEHDNGSKQTGGSSKDSETTKRAKDPSNCAIYGGYDILPFNPEVFLLSSVSSSASTATQRKEGSRKKQGRDDDGEKKNTKNEGEGKLTALSTRRRRFHNRGRCLDSVKKLFADRERKTERERSTSFALRRPGGPDTEKVNQDEKEEEKEERPAAVNEEIFVLFLFFKVRHQASVFSLSGTG